MPQTKQSGKQQKSSVGTRAWQFKIITELELKV